MRREWGVTTQQRGFNEEEGNDMKMIDGLEVRDQNGARGDVCSWTNPVTLVVYTERATRKKKALSCPHQHYWTAVRASVRRLYRKPPSPAHPGVPELFVLLSYYHDDLTSFFLRRWHANAGWFNAEHRWAHPACPHLGFWATPAAAVTRPSYHTVNYRPVWVGSCPYPTFPFTSMRGPRLLILK